MLKELYRDRYQFKIFDRATQSLSGAFILGKEGVKWPVVSEDESEVKEMVLNWSRNNPDKERFVYLMNTGRRDSRGVNIWEGDIVENFIGTRSVKENVNNEGKVVSETKVVQGEVIMGWVEFYRGVFYIQSSNGTRYPLTTNLSKGLVRLSGKTLYAVRHKI